jgi:hypothetical protein
MGKSLFVMQGHPFVYFGLALVPPGVFLGLALLM